MNFKKLFETLTGEKPETEKTPVHQHNYFNDLPRPLTETEKENYYRMSVQRTDADLVVRSEKGVAMDSAEDNNSASQAVYNNMVGAIPDIIYSHFAAQGFIGYNACAILKQNWMISNACTVPAEDAIQPGYTLCNKDDSETISEDELENFKAISYSKFHIDEICKQLEINKKVFGVGLAVPCMDDDYDYENPFNIDGVKPNSYKGWSIVDPYWFAPELDEDAATNPASKYFYQPTWYRMPNGKRVHRSHCIVLTNSIIPDLLKPTYFYGGIPLTQMIFQRVYAAEKVANEAPLLALTKRLLVVDANLENFVANQRDAEETLKTISWLRDNFGVAIKRPGDQIQQIDTGLTDFDSLIMTQYQLVASIAQMPATKLLKTTPKGFNATGEFELKDYIQLLQSIQENDMKPLIERHNLLLAKSKFNKDMQIVVKFNPIDMPTEADKASINQATASTLSTLTQAGIISPEEARARLKQDELAGFPTIDTDAVPEDGEEDIQSMLQNAMSHQKKNDIATDAADWKESEHPRDEEGKFTKKGGGVSGGGMQSNRERFLEKIKKLREKDATQKVQKAITQYTGGHYKEMNEYLRGFVPEEGKSLFKSPEERKEAINMLARFVSQPLKKTVLERMATTEDLEKIAPQEIIDKVIQQDFRNMKEFEDALVGKTFTNEGFTSTSDGFVSADWLKDNPVKFVIRAPEGTLGADVSDKSIQSKLHPDFDITTDEDEIILAPGTKFKIIGVESPKSSIEMDRTRKELFSSPNPDDDSSSDYNPYDGPLVVHVEAISPELTDNYVNKITEKFRKEKEPTKVRPKKEIREVPSLTEPAEKIYSDGLKDLQDIFNSSNDEKTIKEKRGEKIDEVIAKMSAEQRRLEKTVASHQIQLLKNSFLDEIRGDSIEDQKNNVKLAILKRKDFSPLKNANEAKSYMLDLIDKIDNYSKEIINKKVSPDKGRYYDEYIKLLKEKIDKASEYLPYIDRKTIKYMVNDPFKFNPLGAAKEFLKEENKDIKSGMEWRFNEFQNNKQTFIDRIKRLGQPINKKIVDSFKNKIDKHINKINDLVNEAKTGKNVYQKAINEMRPIAQEINQIQQESFSLSSREFIAVEKLVNDANKWLSTGLSVADINSPERSPLDIKELKKNFYNNIKKYEELSNNLKNNFYKELTE